MNKRSMPPFAEEEDDLVRCRRVREEISKRFKTEDEMLAYVHGLEWKYGVTQRGRAAARMARPKRGRGEHAPPPKATVTRGGR